MPTPNLINQYQYSNSIARQVWDVNYQYENWKSVPITADSLGGETSTTDTNILYTPNLHLEFQPLGGPTALAPLIVSVSEGISALNIAVEQTDDMGMELCAGIIDSNNLAFKIGSAPAFFFRVRSHRLPYCLERG